MNLRILFIGDVVGATGRTMLQKHLNTIRDTYAIDATVVNGENCADGRGITPRIMEYFKHIKVDVVTSGNHIWAKRDILPYFALHKDLLRPANYPSECPGGGVTVIDVKGYPIALINVQGRVFMKEHLDCPFKTVNSILTYLRDKTNTIFIDFHAETTSEKAGLAHFFDGHISGLVGTHTHVQTADERILPGGTAFITDLGMVGSLNSMLGMKKETVIEHFITQMPTRFTVDTQPPLLLNGAWIEVDTATGRAVHIERIRIIDEQIQVDQHD